jgi:hypothetical protein
MAPPPPSTEASAGPPPLAIARSSSRRWGGAPPLRRAPLAALRRHGWLVAIVAAYLYLFPYFPAIHSANELPRVYLVKAIVDHHTFAIDDGVARWGATADVSPSGGHQYSNKAPGSSLLAAPAYAALRLVSGDEPSLAVTTWLCRLITGVIPTALFAWLLWGFLARFAPDPAVRRLVLVAYGLGSMAMTYSVLFISHQLAAVCIASAWILALRVAWPAAGDAPVGPRRAAWLMAAAGLLAGAAPLCDYQAGFAGVPVAAHVLIGLWRARGGSIRGSILAPVLAATAGAALPIALLLIYHAICFGSPLRTGYDASTSFAFYHQHGFLGITALRWSAFFGSLFAPDNGLFTLAPWLLLALPGGWALWRSGERGVAMVGAACAVIYVAFISSINFWRGGWQLGPRYITALLPFLLPAIAAQLTAWRGASGRAGRASLIGAAALILVGVTVYALSAATFPHFPERFPNPLYEVVARLLADGAVAPNLGGALGIGGVLGLVPYLAIVGGAVAVASYRVVGGRGLAAAAAIAALWLGAYRGFRRGGPDDDRAYTQWVLGAVRDAHR